MQAGGVIGFMIALAVMVGLTGWWFGRLAVRGVDRLLGRFWARPAPAFRTGLWWFGGLALVAALLLVLAAWMLVPRLFALAGGPGWLRSMMGFVVAVVAAAVAALALAAVLRTALTMAGAYRRRRTLLGLEAGWAAPGPSASPVASLAPAPPGGTGRRIVICCDGTGNRPDDTEEGQPANTNVWKMYHALVCDETQTAWYDAGVGTDTSSTALEISWSRRLLQAVGAWTGGQLLATTSRALRLLEAATGSGITENITQAYTEIVRQYRPGDRIYLIGFSRGAYTARCVAGVIGRCGLLRQEYIRYAPDLVHLYRTRERPDSLVPVPAAMTQAPPQVEFLGLFDTVGSLGVPLWGWWFQALPLPQWRNQALSTNPMSICRNVFHAMAMDERRSQFFPTPFAAPAPGSGTHLEQVWFRGAHADVGGGYAETGLSDIALGWMVDKARSHGLVFREGAFATLRPDPLARLHDELVRSPSWRLFGSWPRWHPVPEAGTPETGALETGALETGAPETGAPEATMTVPPPGTLHASVLERRGVMQRQLGRPDFLPVPEGEAVEVEIQSPREWDRTGLVLGTGWYRVTYLGGHWRSAEETPCGPFGQGGREVGPLRRLAGRWRRLPEQDWLRLCVTIAHPRDWPLKEMGLKKLLHYLYLRDPEELTAQVAAIGGALRQPGDTVWLHNGAAAGVLYAFANDLWLTSGNNAGAIRLRIERAGAPADGRPAWRLRPGGAWAWEARGGPPAGRA